MEKNPHKFWLMILVPKWWSVQGCCLYEYADVPYWDAWISTKSCKNRETCYLMQLYTNAICKTLSRKWQGCTFSVVCFSLVHWCLLIFFLIFDFYFCAYWWGTFINGWVIRSGSHAEHVLELAAVTCLVGCCGIIIIIIITTTPICVLSMLQYAEDREHVWSVV